MPDLPQDANENVCWTCGAPADPGCAQYVRLTAPARDHKDGQGYPVSRHKYGDTVVVHIPRCKDCRNRERLALVLFLVITLVYLVAFGVLASLNVIGGAAVVVIVGGAASFSVLYADGVSRRPYIHYPPLQRLYQAGWKDEDV